MTNAKHPFLTSPEFMSRIVAECLSWPKAKADHYLPQAPADSGKEWSLSFRVARYAATMATTMERSAEREKDYQDQRDLAVQREPSSSAVIPDGAPF